MLTSLSISGFKSIRDAELELRPLNVLIGANGAGKSNLVDFFRLLDAAEAGNQQAFVARAGGAQSLLFEGAQTTPSIRSALQFYPRSPIRDGTAEPSSPPDHDCDDYEFLYEFELSSNAENAVQFSHESLSIIRSSDLETADNDDAALSAKIARLDFGSGHAESRLLAIGSSRAPAAACASTPAAPPLPSSGHKPTDNAAQSARDFLRGIRVFQFHDTSATSHIRRTTNTDIDAGQNPGLAGGGGNLPAVLHHLHQAHAPYYERIIETLRLIVPQFDTFVLPTALTSPECDLRWRARDSSYILGPHQLSDGTLRAMALVTLLLQPEIDLSTVILLDEPELGLHPYAVTVVAGLIKSVVNARLAQVILSTQSTQFLEQFTPEDVLVVERTGRESCFLRLDEQRLDPWLAQYSLGELWEKNILGGRPA